MANDIANDAYQKFLAKNYDQCSASLHSLLSSSPKADPKAQHNIAIADFLKGNCTEPGKFLSDLGKLGKSAEREKRLDHPNATAAVEAYAGEKMMQYRPLCLDFEGHESVKYNQAVTYFQQRRYTEAIDQLMPVYYNPEQVSDLLYVRAILLLLSCTLAQYTHGDNGLRLRISQLLNKLNESDALIRQHDSTTSNPKLAPYATLLKSHYSAIFGSEVEAHKHLTQFLSGDTGNWWTQVTYLNNLGVLSLSNKRPQMASLYFIKAIEGFEKNRPKPEGPSPGLSKYPAMATVYYNNAVCHMLRGQYELAFKSFVVSTPLLKDTPTLWLRLAQCCIKQWEGKAVDEQVKAYKEKVAGVKSEKGFVMPSGDVVGQWVGGCVGSDVEMSLVFADKCVRNAHYLLLTKCKAGQGHDEGDRDEAQDDTLPEDDTDKQPEEVLFHQSTADDLSTSSLLQSIYCNMSYIALCLENYAVALASASKLLSLPSTFKEYKIACLSYCTEAYCKLGRAPEALDLLHSVNLQELLQNPKSCLNLPCGGIQQSEKLGRTTVDVPAFDSCPIHIGVTDEEKEKMSYAHTTALFTNLCVVHITSGKLNRAQQCLNQFKGESQPVADLLQVYLGIAAGDQRGAIAALRRMDMRPPFSLTA